MISTFNIKAALGESVALYKVKIFFWRIMDLHSNGIIIMLKFKQPYNFYRNSNSTFLENNKDLKFTAPLKRELQCRMYKHSFFREVRDCAQIYFISK